MKTPFQQKMVVLSAPSGCGKTTLARGLLNAMPSLAFSISSCTRQARQGEKEGLSYYFTSLETFQQQVKVGAFLEWEEVYTGQCYGTLHSELARLSDQKKHILFDVDVQGALRIKSKDKDQVLSIFIRPPSVEVLENRLRKRATEDETSLSSRLSKAKEELRAAPAFDFVLVNDDQSRATRELIAKVRQFLS